MGSRKISSVSTKFLMALTGAGFVLFLLFHGIMNFVSIISPDGYDAICVFLGANWYAVVGSIGLAVLMIGHIIIGITLTIQNLRARGDVKYCKTERPLGVEWTSQNMLVLGLLILIGPLIHLCDFWYVMQFAELMGREPASGMERIRFVFSNNYYSIIYLIWLVIIWLHLSHGIWSMFQSMGLNNERWKHRGQIIAYVTASIIFILFASVVIYYWLIYPTL